MAKKENKINFVINSLKLIDGFSQDKLYEIELLLKIPKKKTKLLNELRLPIKKGELIKKISVSNIIFDSNKILNCNDIKELSLYEQEILLEIRKDNIISKINQKKLLIPKFIIEKLILCITINEFNDVLKKLPEHIKRELVKSKSRFLEGKSTSIAPIYTPMGNKR